MLNAWDFVFCLAMALSGWLGWKLKSLPLLGAGFVVALAPWFAEWGHERIADYAGPVAAWWILWALSAALLMLIFMGFSNMLAALRLEFLDRSFGCAICVGIFLALLSLNVGRLKTQLYGETRRALYKSWTWKHLRVTKEPAWIEMLEQKVEKLKLPQKP